MDIFGNKKSLVKESGHNRMGVLDEHTFDYIPDEMPSHKKFEGETIEGKSFSVAKIVTIILFIGLFVKLFMSQIIYGKIADDLAQGNKIRPKVIPSARGIILDSDGNWLARNIPTFDLTISPSDLPKERSERDEIYQKLATIARIDFAEIKDKSEKNGLLSLDPIAIRENISREDSLLYEEKIAGLQGVSVAKRSSREYSNIAGLSHIIGYTGKISEDDLKKFSDRRLSDWLGKAGLELQYEDDLHGNDGVEQVEVDSKGNIERVLVDLKNRDPQAGNSLTLYLDSDLQQHVAQYLSEGIEQAKELIKEESISSGVAIVMNPNNGGILAMVSLPSYDNNLFSKGISNLDYQNLINDKSNPMFNRAAYGKYPPGSIIKPLMATAALSEGIISQNTTLDTPPEIKIGDYIFPDWKDHGLTNIETAIAESNNIFFYALGGGYDKIKGMGIEKIKSWWEKFGLGRKTGIDLPGEASGLLPDPEWKLANIKEPWYIGNTYHVSIGQGDLLITPLQMIKVVSAIANGGKLLSPQLVKQISNADGNIIKEFEPRVEDPNIADSEVIKIVQSGMRKAVTMGSARTLSDLPFSSAGKTGTAQFFGNQKTHAWFECYAPYENPEIAVIVLVEGGGGGHEVSVPIARKILEYYFSNK